MDIISNLASSPMPVSIAVIIAVCCLLGYYFFVFPIMDENKKLKEERDAKEAHYEEQYAELNRSFLQQLTSIEGSVVGLRADFVRSTVDVEARYDEVKELLEAMSQHNTLVDRNTDDIEDQVGRLKEALTDLGEQLRTAFASSRAHDETLDRMVRDVENKIASLNEKQSQILGALLGMNRLQDRNRGI